MRSRRFVIIQAILLSVAAAILLIPVLTGLQGASFCPLGAARVGAEANPCLAQEATISAMKVDLLKATIEGNQLRLTVAALQTQISAATVPPPQVIMITATGRPETASGGIMIDLGDSPTWGPADAKVTLIEFSDIQCPFCGQFHREVYPRLRAEYGDKIRYVFKHFPLSSHPDAMPSALAAECAREQGQFWPFLDVAYNNQGDLSRAALSRYAVQAEISDKTQFEQCVNAPKYAERIKADQLQGDQAQVSGTPTFFINGVPFVGAQPYGSFKLALDKALAAAGVQ